MSSYTEPEFRSTPYDISQSFSLVTKSPILDALLDSVGGLLAVLDKNRQIISVNEKFLKDLLGHGQSGEDVKSILGLRLGEVLHCVHAGDGPDGCGTSACCSSCGAALAMVASLALNNPVEKKCAIKTEKNGVPVDFFFEVRSQSLQIDGETYILLFLRDITSEQRRAALEQVFFHDINNTLGALLGASELMMEDPGNHELPEILKQGVLRLEGEINIQKILLYDSGPDAGLSFSQVSLEEIIEELKTTMPLRPEAKNKKIAISKEIPNCNLYTNRALLMRILTNMLVNAFEATLDHGTVHLWVEKGRKEASFRVWNSQMIPPLVADRVFQRNYSTKKGSGRGVGTYSMKLFGEKFLGGEVGFLTSQSHGTVFFLTLPFSPTLH